MNEWERNGGISEGDAYIVDWFVVGNCECFSTKCGKERARRKFEAIWNTITKLEQFEEMVNHPVHRFVAQLLDGAQDALREHPQPDAQDAQEAQDT